jgi:PII-like signaling protein
MDDTYELSGEGLLLRIFIGESDRYEHKPLYEAIMLKARERGIAGCTVMRALAGYGAASRIHTAHITRLSMDLPIVVEIIDTAEKVRAFLPEVEEMVSGGLVTIEPTEVHFYRHEKA